MVGGDHAQINHKRVPVKLLFDLGPEHGAGSILEQGGADAYTLDSGGRKLDTLTSWVGYMNCPMNGEKPNVAFVYSSVRNRTRVYATRDIPEGTQLLACYGNRYRHKANATLQRPAVKDIKKGEVLWMVPQDSNERRYAHVTANDGSGFLKVQFLPCTDVVTVPHSRCLYPPIYKKGQLYDMNRVSFQVAKDRLDAGNEISPYLNKFFICPRNPNHKGNADNFHYGLVLRKIQERGADGDYDTSRDRYEVAITGGEIWSYSPCEVEKGIKRKYPFKDPRPASPKRRK